MRIPHSSIHYSSNKLPRELTYFGDQFSSVWKTGYTILSTENKLSDMGSKDLNGTLVVDTTSEYPYGSLLRLVNGEFLGNDNQARFCAQCQSQSQTKNTYTYTSSSDSEGQTGSQAGSQSQTQGDAFEEGSAVRVYINGTQNLPVGCVEVRLVVEWVDSEELGETLGYS
ncbi:predicted protein [Sclerotinia sclerotiorum 1980 UF-70]|uniref:Uncharacterized protein n=1 Tax=Sclerotinia sclerotiorum (strain ATCC 18683 / 1980 / Ss-1) TaxID=665079 RepID=A7F8K3_SCLS1|nr:predicted protein [Sclerotinia sclerotiorum 1980 UF-70]EDN99074.1 predicted protein [Sclerotinia sclerotiorum 1980 UF-70]